MSDTGYSVVYYVFLCECLSRIEKKLKKVIVVSVNRVKDGVLFG